MIRRRSLALGSVLAVLCVAMLAGTAWGAVDDSEETQREQALARAAELAPQLPAIPPQLKGVTQVTHPLFIAVDDTTVSTYLGDPAIPEWLPQFTGFAPYGAAFDPDNNKVYLSAGSTLLEWPVGGSVATLGTIVDGTGAAQSIVGLAFHDGVLYGVKNIANEAVWIIDPTTLVATVFIDYADADFDYGGFAIDPNTGEFYATNDDTTPNGSGLFRINADATGTLIAPYPTGQTDIDGLAVSDTGIAYLITDEPGDVYQYDLIGGAYGTPIPNPWTSAEVFSAGAWIYEAGGGGLTLCNGPVELPAAGTSTGVASPYPSDITVAGYAGLVTDVDIQLNGLSHTYPDDIDLLLVGPGGENLIIMSDVGGGFDLVGVELVLDDAAAGPLPDSSQITSGSYQPTNIGTTDTFPAPAPTPSAATALATFNDTDPNGTWSLYAYDDASGDSGDLVEWCLVLNGGSFSPGISLVKTVGTDPAVCAATDTITVTAGTPVYYCYEVTNTGDVALELHDLVDDQLGTILDDFAFTLAPGATVNTVDAGLTISTVATATVTNTATWTARSPGVPSTQAEASATVNVLIPDITVSPASLSASQLTNTTTTQQVTIGNAGSGDLIWNIDEAVSTVRNSFPQMMTEAGPGDASVADERVGDPVPPNAKADPNAPVVLWERPQVVLWDNGPLVTHPGGGAGGADASALQVSLGMNTLGAGAQVAAGNRLADDFTVDSNWTVESITFFTYQTGSTTTSTITAVNAQIWDGPPDDPTSTVVWGDPATNLMTSTAWSNIYRVTDTILTTTNRPIMTAVATVNTVLPPGTYWVDYQLDGTLASGPWVPPVTILGQTTTGNAKQFTSTGWADLTDTGTLTPQGVPFIIEGVSSNCYTPTDIPWLSASPTSGTTAPAGSDPVDVTFDSTGIAVGTYDALMCVFSNDPDEPLIEVPVQLEVVIPVELMNISIE